MRPPSTDRRLFYWGDDSSGKLGDGTVADPDDNPSPVQVMSHP